MIRAYMADRIWATMSYKQIIINYIANARYINVVVVGIPESLNQRRNR